MKTVQQVINRRAINVGSIKVQELLPHGEFENPFLLFHHGVAITDKNIPIHQQGVGPHPHRGFSAISFIYKGGVHHQDSRGNNHVVYAGGTQWLHAGMGIVHSERVPENIFEWGGEQELLQVWVNTPATHKMDQPHYYPANADETPIVISNDRLVSIRIPAGELNGVKGIIPTFTEINTFMGESKAGGSFSFSFPKNYQTIFYVLKGEVVINDNTIVTSKQMALFNKDGASFNIKSNTDSLFFVGSGEPINEPITAHGPFVMNTETEIMQAFKDYQLDKMGVLIEN
jgi:redox-sensitive bicupin YhaK (pirin superfamily)